MTNLKLTSKMRLFAIISSVLIVAGMILGTVFHFTSGKFFNYSGEYSSYKSVAVSYVYTEFGDNEKVEEICEKAFADAGIKSYAETSGNTGVGNEITYKFAYSTDDNTLAEAVNAINAKIKEITSTFNDIPQSRAVYQTEDGTLGGEKVLSMAAVALAVIIAVQAIYTVIRFKLSAMCTAFVAQLHNFALYAAVLALCRVPLTSTAMVFAVLLALATAVCVTFTFERIKRNLNDGDYAKLSAEEIIDLSAAQTFKSNVAFCVFLVIVSLLMAVSTVVSALSIVAILSPVLCALVAFVVSCYGSVLFVPSMNACIRKMCGKIFAKPSQNKGK